MILLFPSLVHLKTDEDKAAFQPRCHMFYGQRVMDIPDGLPKWAGLSGSSDLIEDSPEEMVREREREVRREKREEGKDGGEKEDADADADGEEGEGEGKKMGRTEGRGANAT